MPVPRAATAVRRAADVTAGRQPRPAPEAALVGRHHAPHPFTIRAVERLIPLVPRPRAHLTRYHGVLAPAAGWRSQVVSAPTVPRKLPPCAGASRKERSPAARKWTPWAELLRRVFLIDALACPRCPGRLRLMAVVMRKSAIQSILKHLGLPCDVSPSNPPRGPPHDAVAGVEPADAIDWLPSDEFPA